MVGIGEAILLSNLLVTISLLAVTVYRAKIERDQIKIIVKNAKAYDKLKKLRKYLQTEKAIFMELKGEDFYNFLRELTNED